MYSKLTVKIQNSVLHEILSCFTVTPSETCMTPKQLAGGVPLKIYSETF